MHKQLRVEETKAVKETDNRLKGKPGHPEEDMQRALIKLSHGWPIWTLLDREHWPKTTAVGIALRECPTLGHWVFHPPNGGWRSETEAKIMKGMGVVAGVHDLFCYIPVWYPAGHSYAGLWMELKVDDGVQTPNQRVFGGKAAAMGYKCVEVRSSAQYQQTITEYLTGARPWNLA